MTSGSIEACLAVSQSGDCTRAFRQGDCLSQIEPEAKWPLLTLARLKEAQSQLSGSEQPDSGAAPSQPAAEASSSAAEQRDAGSAAGRQSPSSGPLAEARSIYGQLADIDPMRRGYYDDARGGKANVVLNPERVA